MIDCYPDKWTRLNSVGPSSARRQAPQKTLRVQCRRAAAKLDAGLRLCRANEDGFANASAAGMCINRKIFVHGTWHKRCCVAAEAA